LLTNQTPGRQTKLLHAAQDREDVVYTLVQHEERHSFKRFRKTWLRGARCLEDLNNFWMAHKPTTMSEIYSHLHEELELRLDEAQRVGYGFVLPKARNVAVVPIVPKLHHNSAVEKAA
jgi:hypothetical protein